MQYRLQLRFRARTLSAISQVFMMPGSSFLNLLAGSLYGTAVALPLIALLSTVGASGSYWLSRLVVKV